MDLLAIMEGMVKGLQDTNNQNERWENLGILLGHNKGKKRACIAYLFLSAEGQISDADIALLEELGKSFDGFPEMGEIIGDCEEIFSLYDGSPTRFEIVADIFSSYSASIGCRGFDLCGRCFKTCPHNPKDSETTFANNCGVLWMLISLHYNTKGKSDKKRQLIDIWAKENGIDRSIVLEMCDAGETQSAINESKRLLKGSNGVSDQEINSRVLELDKDLKSLEQSVSDLIALGKPIGG
jgi:ferredoxin